MENRLVRKCVRDLLDAGFRKPNILREVSVDAAHPEPIIVSDCVVDYLPRGPASMTVTMTFMPTPANDARFRALIDAFIAARKE